MTAILGFADILLEAGDLAKAPPERIEAATTIKRNGEYLLGIVNDILDLSKIEAGKMTVERISVNPCEVLAQVGELARVRVDAKGLWFDTGYEGPIPETIQTDPTRLRQILINLVGNAIKFTEVGGVRLIARLGERTNGEPRMEFDVADTGIGMTQGQAAGLFRAFTQADTSTTRKFGGTGLGLSISRRLAELLGGEIRIVRTLPNVGTLLRISVGTGPLDGVPMLDDPLAATVVRSDAPTGLDSQRQSDLGGLRILLAEDGPDNQRLIAHYLRKAGADVALAENGKLAVEAAFAARETHQTFDLILMDMQMPEMDGYEATRTLRQRGYTGPIIALTAHAMASDREKCVSAGCDDYTTKPINRKTLVRLVAQHVRRTPTPQAVERDH
jgi:CheY-like chemotaxis protein